jgi:hypothetical protein
MPVFCSALQGEFVPLAPQLAALLNATYNTTNTMKPSSRAMCQHACVLFSNIAYSVMRTLTSTNTLRFALQGEFVPLAPQLAAILNAT